MLQSTDSSVELSSLPSTTLQYWPFGPVQLKDI